MKIYFAVLSGIWIGAALCVPLARYVTIPPMPWLLAMKLSVLSGLFSTPIFMLATWCAEAANKSQERTP